MCFTSEQRPCGANYNMGGLRLFNYLLYFCPGLADMVYPGAVHSRFEHSLGVYWLAGEAMNKITAYQVGICLQSLIVIVSWH